jgi:hypothetical protein
VITGTHVIISSTDAEADRVFLQKVLRFPSIDAGDGWLIFALPPSEAAVHPSRRTNSHELYLVCDDIVAFVRAMKRRRVQCTEAEDHGWGIVTRVSLPGGGTLGVYQSRHPHPEPFPPVRASGEGTLTVAKRAKGRRVVPGCKARTR